MIQVTGTRTTLSLLFMASPPQSRCKIALHALAIAIEELNHALPLAHTLVQLGIDRACSFLRVDISKLRQVVIVSGPTLDRPFFWFAGHGFLRRRQMPMLGMPNLVRRMSAEIAAQMSIVIMASRPATA